MCSEVVGYPTPEGPGTIVIDRGQHSASADHGRAARLPKAPNAFAFGLH